MTTLESHVSRDYRTATPSSQKSIGDDIIKGIGNNPLVFTVLDMPIIPEYQKINEIYGGLITTAESKDTNDINARNSYRDLTWMPATDGFADNVDTTAKGVKATVELSGFISTSDERVSKSKPEKMLIDATGGASGSGLVNVGCKTKLDAAACTFFAITAGNCKITQKGSQLTFTFTDKDGNITGQIQQILTTTKNGEMYMERGVETDIQSIAVNSAGCSPISNKANVIVP